MSAVRSNFTLCDHACSWRSPKLVGTWIGSVKSPATLATSCDSARIGWASCQLASPPTLLNLKVHSTSQDHATPTRLPNTDRTGPSPTVSLVVRLVIQNSQPKTCHGSLPGCAWPRVTSWSQAYATPILSNENKLCNMILIGRRNFGNPGIQDKERAEGSKLPAPFWFAGKRSTTAIPLCNQRLCFSFIRIHCIYFDGNYIIYAVALIILK